MFGPLSGNERFKRIQEKYDQLDYDSDDDPVLHRSSVSTQKNWKNSFVGETEKQRNKQNKSRTSRHPASSTATDPKPGTSKAAEITIEICVSDDEPDDAIVHTVQASEARTSAHRTENPKVLQKDPKPDDLPQESDLDLYNMDGDVHEKPSFRFTPSASKVPFLLSTTGEEPVIQVPATINQYLRDYQRNGIKFLYNNYRQKKGAILGDDMGLGKTVQVISFMAAVLMKQGNKIDVLRQKPKFIREMSDSKEILDKLDRYRAKPFLIIGPGSILYNWVDELETWGYFTVGKFHGKEKTECEAKLKKGKYEVVITTFETFRDYVDVFNSFEWEAVIADEVHCTKVLKAKVTQALRKVNTNIRYGLTGTALQNNMTELWTLMDWAQPGFLGSYAAFREEYANPIEKGQKQGSTKRELAHARKVKAKFAELRNKMLLRRTKKLITDQLPSKDDNVVFCKLTDLQTGVYRKILDHPAMSKIMNMENPCACGSGNMQKSCCEVLFDEISLSSLSFTFMHLLLKVANHIALLIPDQSTMKLQSAFALKICKLVSESFPEYFSQTKEATFRTLSDPQYCGKMKILQGLLSVFYRDHSKVLLFSYSTRVLNIIEQYLMTTGYEYRRLDGKTSLKKRIELVREFNKDPNIFIFIISTKAGGLGLNLTGANRVIIFDPSWNPTNDLQAQDRAYRIGQRRNVQVYRLISAGTIEENMYLRQVYKQQLESVAVSSENARRYFSGTAGNRDDKGELFGIKNMFQLRTGDSCLTMDILKRNKKLEDSLSNFKIADYIPGTPPQDKQEADNSTGSESEKSPKSDSEEEDDGYYKEIFDLHDVSSEENDKAIIIDEESPRKKSPQKSANRIKKTSSYQQEQLRDKKSPKYKKDFPHKHKGRQKSTSEGDKADDKCTPSSVGAVFDQCGVIHVHENRNIVGGSKAEDHMSRCAIQEVYEHHQNLQVPAAQCDPYDESSESSEEVQTNSRGRNSKTDHNTPRNAVVGNSKVLIGQTPKAIRQQHLQKMCKEEKCDSVIDFAEKILSSSVKDRIEMLKKFYTAQKPELIEIFKEKLEESKGRTVKSSNKVTPRNSKSQKRKKQSIRHKQGLSVQFVSESESFDSIESRRGIYGLGSKEDSLEVGKKPRKIITKTQVTTRLRQTTKVRKGKPKFAGNDVGADFVQETYVEYETDDAENDDTSTDNQNVNADDLLIEIGQPHADQHASDHSQDDGNRKTSDIDRESEEDSMASKLLNSSVFDDLFGDIKKSPRKPPPARRKRHTSQISGSTDLFADEAESVIADSDVNKSMDYLNESTLKDDSFDCFSGPPKKSKRKKKDPEIITNKLLSKSEKEHRKLFQSGKMKKISQCEKKGYVDDGVIEDGGVNRTPSLF